MPRCPHPACQREYVEWHGKFTAAARKWNAEWARKVQLDDLVFKATTHEAYCRVNYGEGVQTRQAEQLVQSRQAQADACESRVNELYLDVEALENGGPFVILQCDTEVEVAVVSTPAANPAADMVAKLVRAGLSPEELEREIGRLMGLAQAAKPNPRVVDPD
jgi:hypothetical protein